MLAGFLFVFGNYLVGYLRLDSSTNSRSKSLSISGLSLYSNGAIWSFLFSGFSILLQRIKNKINNKIIRKIQYISFREASLTFQLSLQNYHLRKIQSLMYTLSFLTFPFSSLRIFPFPAFRVLLFVHLHLKILTSFIYLSLPFLFSFVLLF